MKRWCGVFLVVAMTACSEYNREAVQDNNAGMALMRQGRLADARDKFQRAADADPKFDQPLYNLSLVHVKQREWAPAAEALTRAIARNPRNAEYHFQLGKAHYNQEHWEQARTAFQQATQVSPNYYLAYFWQGLVAERLDDPQSALQAYTTALTKAPRSYSSYAHLGRLYRQVHEYDRAAQVPREGLRIAPEGAVERGSMHNVLGNVLLEQGQRDAAVEEFVAANREDPEMSEAMFSAGYTLADVPERRQQAILYLQRFVEARGGNAPREYLDIAQNKLAQLQSAGTH